MRKIIQVGITDAEAGSRRHILRTAGFDVITVPAGADPARLAIEHSAQLIIMEPGASAATERSAIAAPPGVPVLDLDLDWETLTERQRASDLALSVCALLRLNAAEQALRESDARFRSVADAAPVLIWSSGSDRLRDYFNQPWLYFTGRASDQELGEGWAQGLHPQDREHTFSVYHGAFDARCDYEVEYRLRHREGGYRWVLERGAPRYTPDGIFAGYAGSCIDITERKYVESERERLLSAQVAQRELAEASERRSALLAEISDLLSAGADYRPVLDALAAKGVPLLADCCVIDLIEPDGQLQRGGRACASMEARRTFDGYAARSGAGDRRDPLVQAAMAGKPVVVERVSREWLRQAELDADHGRLLEELGVHALFVVPLIAYGERLGAMSFLLTDPQRSFTPPDVHLAQEMASRIALGLRNGILFAEAQSARRQAEEASRVKDEFLATVSHELRQPVHAIGGWVRLLKTGKLPAEKAAHALQMIEQNVALQAQIVRDLLDVSAMISGQFYLEVTWITLGPVIEAAIEAVRPAADAKDITLGVELASPGRRLRGDAKRLQQALWNLLYNAVKFTPRGGRVELSLSSADDHAQIIVTDNGPGIDAEFLPHVFDHFRQQDSTTTRRHGGLGLGLAIVRHVVELHAGEVQAGNVGRDGGARFVVKLPYEAHSVQPVAVAGESRVSST